MCCGIASSGHKNVIYLYALDEAARYGMDDIVANAIGSLKAVSPIFTPHFRRRRGSNKETWQQASASPTTNAVECLHSRI